MTITSFAEQPKYHVVVVHQDGVIIRNQPRPQSLGAARLRAEPVGTVLQAYNIHRMSDGVRYARLVPRGVSPEWARVEEADGSVRYLDEIPLDGGAGNELANALRYLGDCLVKAVKALSSEK
jgi:hypothetical protein